MKKALANTEHKQVLSSLILSAHNPFNSSIPQVSDPETNKEIQGKTKGPLIDSWFREIFYLKDYGKKTGIISVDNEIRRNGAEHLIYITERIIVPNLRNKDRRISLDK